MEKLILATNHSAFMDIIAFNFNLQVVHLALRKKRQSQAIKKIAFLRIARTLTYFLAFLLY